VLTECLSCGRGSKPTSDPKSPQPTPSLRILAHDLVAQLGVAPFFVFAAMFLIVPTASLLIGA
jgi:putative spermidine/putrescine transport system permease protein